MSRWILMVETNTAPMHRYWHKTDMSAFGGKADMTFALRNVHL